MTLAKFNPNDSVASLTIAELEQLIQTTIERYTHSLVPPT